MHVPSGHSTSRRWLSLCPIASRVETDDVHHYCWLCGGWSEQRIRCKIEFDDENEEFTENHRLFVHLQCDNWKGMPTHFRSLGDSVVEFHRVLPPGRQYFFFTKKNMSTSDAKYVELTHVK